MGLPVELNATQEDQKNQIISLLAIVREKASRQDFDEEYDTTYESLTNLAFSLSTSLDQLPIFTESVLTGAEDLTPNDREFYNHIHVIEDLLNYLEDTDSNNSPDDTTLNQNFEFRVHSNRWGHYDTYHLTRNSDGWFISHNAYSQQGEIDGSPILNRILEHDSITYPHNLNDYISRTWHNAHAGATREEIQNQLNDIAEWISTTERNKPYTL